MTLKDVNEPRTARVAGFANRIQHESFYYVDPGEAFQIRGVVFLSVIVVSACLRSGHKPDSEYRHRWCLIQFFNKHYCQSGHRGVLPERPNGFR